jgi:hypothetical protein
MTGMAPPGCGPHDWNGAARVRATRPEWRCPGAGHMAGMVYFVAGFLARTRVFFAGALLAGVAGWALACISSII